MDDNTTRNNVKAKQASVNYPAPNVEKTVSSPKPVASTNNTQHNTNNNAQIKNTERKAASSAPVYFGED
jgi:hypothetical protein